MAYQPKSYRKFLAGSVSAALVATAIGPVVANAASFSDVDPSDSHAADISALVEKGYIKGFEDGTFKPYSNVTRGQVAKIFARILKEQGFQVPADKKAFDDVPVDSKDQELVEAAAIVKAAGVMTGTDGKLNPSQNITRQQMAKVLVEAFDLTKPADFKSQITDLEKADAYARDYIQTLEANGVTVVKEFNPKGTVTRAAFASFVKRALDVQEAAKAPKVESVSAINAKQIEIKFNKAVDKSTVFSNVTTGTLNAGVVTVKRTVNDTTDTNKNVDSSVDAITGSLSADGKTLTLTVDVTSAKYFDGTYAVTVSDSVKTTDGKAIEAYAGTFTAKDKTAPTVKDVVYNTITNEVEVTFTEPVTQVPDVVRLNGEPVSGVAFVSNTNQTKVKFTKPSSVAAGSTASIYVAGTTDAASNILSPYNGNVTFTNDASALQVTSVTQISSNQLKVVFNKSLASNDATIDGALTAIIDGNVVGAGNVTAALDTTDTSNKTVIVTFSGTAPNYFYGSANSKAVTLVFADNVITDVFGKKLAATTQSVTMTKDVAGPKVVSAKVASNGRDIEVTFDEAISGVATDIDTSKIVLRKDGVALSAVASATQKAATGDDAKVLVITPAAADLVSGKLPAGTYTVRLDAGAVKDAHTNTNAAATTTVSISATTTDLTATIANKVSGSAVPNVFEVTFSEDVTAASALNPANYTLDGAALPSGTDIYFKSGAANRTVVIELPSNSINIGSATTPANAVLAVKNVQTSTGKTVVATSGTVKVKDNTAATLQSATLVGNNILKLTFNENIAPVSFTNLADILDDIQISNGTTTFTAGDATATASVSGKDLIITVTPGTTDNWSTVTSSPTVTVQTLGTGDGDIQDVNGVIVKGDVSVTLAK